MSQKKENSNQEILRILQNLDRRISAIEEHLDVTPADRISIRKPPKSAPENSGDVAESIEFNIGQFWFAKVGIFVLALGIIFILTFPYRNLPPYFPSLIGFALVGIIWTTSFLMRNSFAHVSGYLSTGGLLLLYFSTLRLHYFGEEATIDGKPIILALLVIVVAVVFFISLRRGSVFNCGIAMILSYITAIISESPLFIFLWISISAVFSTLILLKYKWYKIFNLAIVLTYLFHFLWFINNPFLGNKIQLVSGPAYNIWFILIYIALFALAALYRTPRDSEDGAFITGAFLNSGGGYLLLLLVTLTKFPDHLSMAHSLASMLFIGFAILYWVREKSKYATFFYAIIGYTALSVAIIAQFEQPNFFIWLSWQSLIVISTAIWFRSKFIIFANFIIYLILFFSYLFIATEIGGISLSFGFVALVTARLLNWQKDRLDLKTEFMRNAYLTCAFFIFPFTLFHMMPAEYVPLSWIAVTLLYYILSVTLKNVKYRWMALFTLLLTVLYVLVIGIIQLEPVYRIVSFIVLGLVLVIASLFYTRMRIKKEAE
jgi:hypothetical protein